MAWIMGMSMCSSSPKSLDGHELAISSTGGEENGTMQSVATPGGRRKICFGDDESPRKPKAEVETFDVEIELDRRPLGATIDPETLAITVIKDGSIKTYNQCIEDGRGRSKDRPCREGDRFLQVNGVRVQSIEQFAEAMKMQSVMRATLQRCGKEQARGSPSSPLNAKPEHNMMSLGLKPAPRQDSRSLELNAGHAACGVLNGHSLDVQGITSYMKEQGITSYMKDNFPKLMTADPRQLLADLGGPAKEPTEESDEESDDDILDLIECQPHQRKGCVGSETDPELDEADVETVTLDIELVGGTLGATLDPTTWAIIDIKEGSVKNHNRRCGDNPLFLGDRFIEVNGVKIDHPEQMRDAIQGSRTGWINAVLQRPKASFFAPKALRSAGINFLTDASPRLGFSCCKGRKQLPNQDSWCAIELEGTFAIYGVFDGHGPDGHHVSQFVKDQLPKAILRDPRFMSSDMSEMLKESFLNMQSQITVADRRGKLKAQDSGSTATVVIHDVVNKRLVVAHVGDSTTAIAKKSRGALPFDFGLDLFASWDVSPLSEDHKPNDSRELARIKKAGGRVEFDGRNHRVYASRDAKCGGLRPGLNLSRSFGDLEGDNAGVTTAEPDIREHVLTGDEDLLLLGSDGVWEYMPPAEAGAALPHQGSSPEALAEGLATEARQRWCKDSSTVGYVDDITAVVVVLKPQEQTARHDFLGAFSAR